jgi:hypothetical protein
MKTSRWVLRFRDFVFDVMQALAILMLLLITLSDFWTFIQRLFDSGSRR